MFYTTLLQSYQQQYNDTNQHIQKKPYQQSNISCATDIIMISTPEKYNSIRRYQQDRCCLGKANQRSHTQCTTVSINKKSNK